MLSVVKEKLSKFLNNQPEILVWLQCSYMHGVTFQLSSGDQANRTSLTKMQAVLKGKCKAKAVQLTKAVLTAPYLRLIILFTLIN